MVKVMPNNRLHTRSRRRGRHILSLVLGGALLSTVGGASAANVSGVSASPNPFDPGSAETTTIAYTLTNNALLWLRIYDGGGTLQRALVTPSGFTSTNRSSGTPNEVWDGKDDLNNVLADGDYPYQIDNVFFSAHYSLGQNPHDVAVDPANTDILWRTDKTSPYVFKSTNGGSSWSGVSGTGSSAKAYGIVVSADGQKIYITDDGQSSLNMSTNGGGAWTTSASFPGSATTISDVTISSDGSIVYVLDYGNNSVYKSTNSGSSWSSCAASGLSLGGDARGIATDPTGTTVIVADSSNHRLFKSSDSCASFSQISGVTNGTAAGKVNYPYQVSLQSDGKFWVSERDNNRIQQFDTDGNSLMVYGGTGIGTGNYQFASGTKYFGIGLASISGQAYVYVADYDNTRIKQVGYDNWASSTHLTLGAAVATTTVGTATATAASASSIDVSMPYSDDSNNDNTYTVDYKLSSAGSWTNWVTAAVNTASPYTTTITGLTPGESYDVRMSYNDTDGVTGTNPQTVSNISLLVNTTTVGSATATAASSTSIDVSMPYSNDANGDNTYSVDYKLSSAGSWTNWVTGAAHATSPYATTITGLTQGGTYDVRATYNDADGVTGTNPQTVSSIALPSGASNISSTSASPSPFNPDNAETTTIAYTLASSALTWIKIYNSSNFKQRDLLTPGSFSSANKSAGANSSVWDGKNNGGATLSDGQYPYHIDDAFFTAHHASPGSNPHDIAVDPNDSDIWWLLDKTSPYVFKSTNGGSSWSGVSGTGADAKAYGIAISSDGQKIYIADDGKSSLISSSNGGSAWGNSASFPGGATTVVDVAISDDGAIVYALDYNSKIYKSTNSGASWTTCGAGGLSATNPRGIATSADGTTVIVTDSGNDDLYQSTDSCGFFFGYGKFSGSASGSLSYPYQVAIESDGKFWVSERDNHRIQQFDENGNVLMTYGGSSSGSGNFQFNSGASRFGIGLARIADQTSVLVADYNNSRIKVVGYDNWTSSTHAVIASAPPEAPTSLSAADTAADNGGSIGLFWTVSTSSETTEQRVYRSTTSGSGYTLLATISDNTTSSYVDTTAVNGTTYYYILRAFNGAQESADSNEDSATAVDNLVPAAPTSLNAGAGDGEVYLDWSNSVAGDVLEQRIYRSTTSGSGFSLLTTFNDNSTITFTDTTVSNETTYYYIIRAYDGTQESADSNEASASPSASIVNPPTGLSGAEGDATVDLSWTVSTSATTSEQRIYRSTTSGSGYALVGTIADNISTTYTDSSVTNDTTYYYVLRAYNGTAESANSNEVSVTPSANALPVAADANLYVLKDATAYGTLGATDEDGDALTYALVGNASQGTVTITDASTGAYQYVPDAAVTGSDSFTFKANDGRADSNVATISVEISGPVAGTTLSAGMNYWHMISIPTQLSQKNDFYSILVDDLGFAPNPYKWVGGSAGTWDGSYNHAPTAEPGKGYWLVVNAASSVTIDDQYNGENVAQCDPVNFAGLQCVDVTLAPGANVIGDPYPVAKDLLQSADVRFCNSTASGGCGAAGDWVAFTTAVSNGWVLNTIYRYNPATQLYDSTKSVADGNMSISPWEGWWLRVETNDTMRMRFYR